MRKRWIKLKCALSSRDRFIVKTEIPVELAGEVAHPKRGRIDPRCALQVRQRFVAITSRGMKGGDKIVGWCRIRINFHCAIEFRLRSIKVPIEDTFGLGEIHVGLCFLVIEFQRTDSGIADLRKGVKRRSIKISQPEPRLRDPGPRPTKLGIFRKRVLKKFKALT